MNLQEFSAQFDVLYNNITSNQAPGLNEYEKSVFLTKAQSQLVNEYFNRRTDGVGGGFDGSQKRQYDFSTLINTKVLARTDLNPIYQVDRRSIVYAFPKDYFLAINEIAVDSKYQYSIVPLSFDEYQRLMLKPYNFPVKRAAWRFFSGRDRYNEYTNQYGYRYSVPALSDAPVTIKITAQQNASISASTAWTSSTAYVAFDTDNVIALSFNLPSPTEYQISCYLKNGTLYDDYVIKALKAAAAEVNWKYAHRIIDTDHYGTLINGCQLTDWFYSFQAPAGDTHTTFITDTAVPMTATIVDNVPAAEVIGKFEGVPSYQLRYIKKPTPIILDDLTNYGTNLTIDGEDSATECTLPEETHQEILERAVTLAKIAWAGGTATQAAAQQRGNND